MNERKKLPSAKTYRPSASGQVPFVFVNMAIAADGKIATANRSVSSFGSRHDHDHLLALRATADAVICGARTADLNAINMGPGPLKYRRRRVQCGLAEYNLRVIVSRAGTIDPAAEVFKHRFSPIIILTTHRAAERRLRSLRAVADEVKVWKRDEIDFRQALRWLRAKWGVKRLLCEGGGEINDALFRAGLVNELHLTVCPRIVGGRAAPTIADGLGIRALAGAIPLELQSARRRGDEMYLVYRASR
jgi:riboflavin-specific deaminase-like protein